MYALVAMCVTLGGGGGSGSAMTSVMRLLEEGVVGTLRERHGDDMSRMGQSVVSAYDELFSYSCPKFVTPVRATQGVRGPGSRVQGLESRVQGPGSRVQGPGSRVQGPSSKLQAPGSKLQAPSSRVQGPWSMVQGPDFRVQSPRSKVQGPEILGIGDACPRVCNLSPTSVQGGASPEVKGV